MHEINADGIKANAINPKVSPISHTYLAFGLCLSLPFAVSQLTPAPPTRAIDIQVTFGTTPETLPTCQRASRDQALAMEIQIGSQGEMLWTTPRARYWASNGTQLVIEPLTKVKPATLRPFALYTALAALLNQRGYLALHANAVVGAQGAIVFTGKSGAGKSTLLAALMARGLPMLADDLTVIETPLDGAPTVLPGYPSYRLCTDALMQLDPAADRIVSLGGVRNKHMVFAPKTSLHEKPVALHALYILNPSPRDELRIRRVVGLQAFQLLQESCYAPTDNLLLPHALRQLQNVAQQCAVYQIDRPANRWTIDELADLLLATEASTAQPLGDW